MYLLCSISTSKREVRSSYNFKKGKSHSTLGTEVTQEVATAKRPRLSKESRDNKISFQSNELEFKVKTAQRQKVKVLLGAPTEMQYEKAKKLSEEISKKKGDIYRKQTLIGELTTKSRKSSYYYRNQSSDILQHSQNRSTGDRWLKF